MNNAIDKIITFLQQTFQKANKTTGVIAVSGGIDSAVVLTLLTKALGPDHVIPVLLPYHDQPMDDALAICEWNHIPERHWIVRDIGEVVDVLSRQVGAPDSSLRKGNIMARVRMIMVYDTAKEHDGLVCGTENKSEHYLGYFTRFGDAASDIEPLAGLYKSQVRDIATALSLPAIFLDKAPSAGLWAGQTDEEELGFTYNEADHVIAEYLQEQPEADDITPALRQKIRSHIERASFKHAVPYVM